MARSIISPQEAAAFSTRRTYLLGEKVDDRLAEEVGSIIQVYVRRHQLNPSEQDMIFSYMMGDVPEDYAAYAAHRSSNDEKTAEDYLRELKSGLAKLTEVEQQTVSSYFIHNYSARGTLEEITATAQAYLEE